MKLFLQTKERGCGIFWKQQYILNSKEKTFIIKDLRATDIWTIEFSRMVQSETLKFLIFHLQISSNDFHFISMLDGKIKW